MITSESYDQFSKRVNFTIENYSIEEIDKIIKSMLNRIKKILQRKRSTPAVLVFFFFVLFFLYICYRLNLHEISLSLKVKSTVQITYHMKPT